MGHLRYKIKSFKIKAEFKVKQLSLSLSTSINNQPVLSRAGILGLKPVGAGPSGWVLMRSGWVLSGSRLEK